MAKKNAYYPCNKQLRLAMAAPLNPVAYVQVDFELSKQNRRLYRQGRVYSVKVDVDLEATPNTGYTVFAINNTWMLKKAWQTAMETYKHETLTERNVFNGKLARWNDFRLDLSSLASGGSSIQSTRFDETFSEQRLTDGEYVASTVANDSGQDRTFGLVESGARYNILLEFDKTGNMDTDPNSATAQVAYDDLDSDMQDTEVEDITGNGNAPPYAQNDSHWNYPLIKIGEVGHSTEGQRMSTGYFDAPFGFVVIIANSGTHQAAGSSDLTVTVKGGDYKGVAAHSLME